MPDGSTIFFGIVFGAVGLAVFRHGRRETNFACLFIGLALMVYPYFVEGLVLNVLVGLGLTGGAWMFWDAN